MLKPWWNRRGSPPLYWWRPAAGARHGFTSNLGDELNPWLYKHLTGQQAMLAKPRTKKKILGIGSILHAARPGDTVWGSGLNGKVRNDHGEIYLPPDLHKVEFRAVRGPLTRALLVQAGGDVPEVYGDPALLLSQFVQPLPPVQRRGTLILPHYSDHEQTLRELPDSPEIRVQRIDAPVETILEAINSSARVLTTALHGIVAAEALSVPVTFFRLGTKEDMFKYEDYFAGTGRSLDAPSQGLYPALQSSTLPPLYPVVELKQKMVDSCPF